jgi:hypothetical protein
MTWRVTLSAASAIGRAMTSRAICWWMQASGRSSGATAAAMRPGFSPVGTPSVCRLRPEIPGGGRIPMLKEASSRAPSRELCDRACAAMVSETLTSGARRRSRSGRASTRRLWSSVGRWPGLFDDAGAVPQRDLGAGPSFDGRRAVAPTSRRASATLATVYCLSGGRVAGVRTLVT